MYQDDELYHYGVKGMKWGVRRQKIASKGDTVPKGMYRKGSGVRTHVGKGGSTSKYTRDMYRTQVTLNGKTIKEHASNAGNYIRSRNAYNKGYSDRQRKNDRALYGNGAERRINRKLNKGYGLQGARHFEVERKERKESREKARKQAIKRGTRAAKRLAKAGVTMWAYDQVFNGGRGTRAVKNGMKMAASLGVYAFRTARQAYWDTHPTYTVD